MEEQNYVSAGINIRCPFPDETTHGLLDVELIYLGFSPDVHPDTIKDVYPVCKKGMGCLRKCNLSYFEDKVPCEICGQPTSMTGTKRCNRCWDLERRIRMDPSLAERIVTRLKRSIIV